MKRKEQLSELERAQAEQSKTIAIQERVETLETELLSRVTKVSYLELARIKDKTTLDQMLAQIRSLEELNRNLTSKVSVLERELERRNLESVYDEDTRSNFPGSVTGSFANLANEFYTMDREESIVDQKS